MNVSIKDLQVKDMGLGNNGIEVEVYDNQKKHRGDLIVAKGGVEWCPGRTRRGGGIKKSWEDFIACFE